MATVEDRPDEASQELAGVVIGWRHRTFARNIHLTVQSTTRGNISSAAVGTHHLLMTRNQAMLLANYLMRLTGQTPAPPRRRSWIARLFG